MHRAVRHSGLALVGSLILTLGAGPSAFAGVTCTFIPSMCPPSTGGGGDRHSVPEPGTLGLLAVGAAAGVARLRRHLKKKN